MKIDGSTVTTPSLSAGVELEIRYYPAFVVLPRITRDEYREHNDLEIDVTLFETPLQVPA